MSKYLYAMCFLILAVGLLASAPRAEAASKEHKASPARWLELSGPMVPGTYERFRASLDRGNPQLVVLDGPGGHLVEAVLIGTEIRRRGLSTVIRANRSCASACAVAYLAGARKYAGAGAEIGLHPASGGRGRVDPDATQLMVAYLRDMGVPAALLRAKLSRTTVWWLSGADKRALEISGF